MSKIGHMLSFDAGIEQILTRQGSQPLNLPGDSPTLPGEGLYEQRLAEVLLPPSVEQELIESFRPEITHRDVQTPHAYLTALRESRGELEKLAKSAAEGPDRQALRAAVERLDAEEDGQDQISTYRNLLVSA